MVAAIMHMQRLSYNHVFESESEHVIEIDDTKDNERLFTSHRTGTHRRYLLMAHRLTLLKAAL